MSPISPATSFLSVCIQKLYTDGPNSLTHEQCTQLETLRDDGQRSCPLLTDKVHTVHKLPKVVNAEPGKRKKTKAANASVQLPTGTPVFRTIGDRTFEATWNNEDRTLIWEDSVYPSPTAFCKACYASIHGPEKTHSINGQAACYVLREGKRVTLEKLRDETTAKS